MIGRRRTVRARLGARRSAPASVATIGRLVQRVLPGARKLPADLAGRAAVFAMLGAFALGSSRHGVRALAGAPLGVYAGWRGAFWLQDRDAKAKALEVDRELPPFLDRLTTCILAGMSVDKALRTTAPGTPGVLGEAAAEGLRALDAGVTRARAYSIIAARAGSEDVRALTATLTRAERYGTSVSSALLAHATQVRARQRARAEAESRTAPVKMVFPLVFCFLPAFVVLTIAPIALSAIRTIGGIR